MPATKRALFTAICAMVWSTRPLYFAPPQLGAAAQEWSAWGFQILDGVSWVVAIFMIARTTLYRVRDRGLQSLVVVWLVSSAAVHSMPDGLSVLGLALIWSICLQDISAGRQGLILALATVLLGLGSPVVSFLSVPIWLSAIFVTFNQGSQRRRSLLFFGAALLLVLVVGKLRWSQWFGRAPGLWMDLQYQGNWSVLVRALLWDCSFVLALGGCLYLRRQGLQTRNRALLLSAFGLALLAPLFLPRTVAPHWALVSLVPLALLPCVAFLDQQLTRRPLWMGLIWGSIFVQLHVDGFRSAELTPRTPRWMPEAWPLWTHWLIPCCIVFVVIWLSYDALRRIGPARERMIYAAGMVALLCCSVIAHRWAVS